jgi:hypothetical protein
MRAACAAVRAQLWWQVDRRAQESLTWNGVLAPCAWRQPSLRYNAASNNAAMGGEMEIMVKPVIARYQGGQRALVESGERSFAVGQRTDADATQTRFCPIELVVSGLAA